MYLVISTARGSVPEEMATSTGQTDFITNGDTSTLFSHLKDARAYAEHVSKARSCEVHVFALKASVEPVLQTVWTEAERNPVPLPPIAQDVRMAS
jgi:hypothetical protein